MGWQDEYPSPEQLIALCGNFNPPEMKDAAKRLKDALARAQAERDRKQIFDQM